MIKLTIKFKHLPHSGKYTSRKKGGKIKYYVRHMHGDRPYDHRLPKFIWKMI